MASNSPLYAVRDTPALQEKPVTTPTVITTFPTSDGLWTVRTTPVAAYDINGQHDLRYNVVATFVPNGGTKVTRMNRRERLTLEATTAYDPAADFRQGLNADHRHARWIRGES